MTTIAEELAVAVGEGRVSRWRSPRRGNGALPRRGWALVLAGVAVGWSVWALAAGRGDLVNPGGWPLVRRFWAAALQPELSAEFVRLTARSTLTTVAFAVLGTLMSTVVGLMAGALVSETWWRSEHAGAGRRTRPGWLVSRAVLTLPRGTHEAVWGLLLVNVLGRDPLVGVLAIGIPFGAITAKVYAELVDEAAGGEYDALRAAGAGRVAALAYGVLPRVAPDLVSYGFYRLECSVRAAVILGIIGAGGLGFQLALSFQSLRYEEMWTLIYALVLVSGAADWWSSVLRNRPSRRATRISLTAALGLAAGSALHLRVDLSTLWSPRARELAQRAATDAWPPGLPSGGWSELWSSALDTVQMSIVAIAIATGLAVVVAFVAARGVGGRVRATVARGARVLLLVTRAVPPPVWALLVLFVMFPGPLTGSIALGVYNFGVIGRLLAEVVENADPGPAAALRGVGVPSATVFTYAVVPALAGRFAAYSLYRWEVAIRETVVVGLVGAGGLGRLLAQQNAAFDYGAMLTTVLVLLGLTLVVDAISRRARRTLR